VRGQDEVYDRGKPNVSNISSRHTGEVWFERGAVQGAEEEYESLQPGGFPSDKVSDEEMRRLVAEAVEKSDALEENKPKLQEIFQSMLPMFMTSGAPIRPDVRARHRSVLTEDKVVRMRSRQRYSEDQKAVIKEALDEMINLKVIRPSKSPWSAATVMVRKPDGSWRMCIDFRGVNAITKVHAHPIRLIDDVLSTLSQAKYFTAIDMYKGYWQVPMAEEDMEKAAFNTPFGHWEYMYMPMGCVNGSSTYQRMMGEVLAPFIGTCVAVYIDDIFIYSDTEEEHMRHLEEVMATLKAAGLKSRPDKTQLCRKEIKVLGFVLSEEGLRPLREKIDKLLAQEVEPSQREILSFIGLARYYERFCPKLAEMARPLYGLLQKGNNPKDGWGEEHDLAVRDIKRAFQDEDNQVMERYDPSKPLLVQTDASDFAMG
jgi:hypothetical protein